MQHMATHVSEESEEDVEKEVLYKRSQTQPSIQSGLGHCEEC